MKDIPHWQWLVVLYLFIVVIPLLYIHGKLKKLALGNRTFSNLFLYFAGVLGGGFLLHSLAMYLYFTFFFTVRH